MVGQVKMLDKPCTMGLKLILKELFPLWRHGSAVVVLRQRGQEEFLRGLL
jgi:hypothetical protein